MKTSEGMEIYITSVYMDRDIPNPPVAFLKLLGERRGAPILICTDSNAHSSDWGGPADVRDPIAKARGEWLSDLIVEADLSIVNSGSENTFVTSRAKSIIDITIASHA